jgi:hypothetical protein
MPAIITATQLRNVLGVSSALYDDTYLNQIIDSAEDIILPMLVQNSSKVAYVSLTSNVAYYFTVRPHGFTTGQSIVISGLPAPFNGTKTVTNDYRFLGDYSPQYGFPYPFLPAGFPAEYSNQVFSAAVTNADIELQPSIPQGTAYLSGYNAATLYASTPAVESAVYVVSTEIFQSRLSIGGQLEGVDFAPTPFRLGRSLLSRVQALLAPYLDVETMAQ